MLMCAHEGSQHDRADVQKRINDAPNELSVHQIRTSDIARLMELFQVRAVPLSSFSLCTNSYVQSSLLKYWQFEPEKHKKEKRDKGKGKARAESDPPQSSTSSARWGLRRRRASEDLVEERRLQEEQHRASSETDRRNADDANRTLFGSEGKKSEAPRKRMPVC